jgi:small nuclear ribonucleoprotein (snRNP)-like protein
MENEALKNLIGKRFSVINKNDSRFQGTLDSLDMAGSFIILRNVKNCGTEDRNIAKFEPALPHIVPFISFHAKDISDIKISEEEEPEVEPSDKVDHLLEDKLTELLNSIIYLFRYYYYF